MKRVSLFQTSDGTTFADKGEAKLHEAKLDFQKEIDQHFFPLIKAAPEAKRMVVAMTEEPEIFLTALTTYSKLRKRLHKPVLAE